MRSLQYLLVLLFSFVLTACGGGASAPPAPAATYSISGTVSGSATSGVLITLSGTSSATATTAAGGTYTFSGLSNGNYTVTPSLAGNVFTSTSSAVTVSSVNVTGTNFTATANAAATYTISGTVSGAATSGVTITLSGTNSGTTITGAGGTYSFPGQVAGSYTVTPSLASYTFSPTNIVIAALAANSTGNNFTATAITYSISGTVSGNATSGVTMTLSGASSATTTTGGGGTYTFSGLSNGSYTVTPSLAGNVFTPTSSAVTVSGANVTGKNFVAASNVVPTYTISGTVSGAATSGVTVALSGASTGSVTTGAGGTYSFPGLVAGSYTVTPTLVGYTFSPTNIAIPALAANSSGNNFTATAIPPATYSISGTVSGNATSGVTMTLSGAGSTAVTTGAGGTYSFTGLSNGNYTVTPSLAGNAFTPTSRAVTISGASVTGRDFVAASNVAPTYTISGTVSGAVTSGVTVSLGGGGGSTTTGAGGTYSFTGLVAGSYTVIPSLAGYSFSPANIVIASLAANSTGNNFTASAVLVPHSISGNVSGPTGVSISVTGTAIAGTTTDGSGNYTVNGLFDGSYTVTPSLAGYTFTPNSSSVTMNGANVTGKNFAGVANAAVLANVSGTVTGAWNEGVTITMSGGASGTTTTNASGNYSFLGLPSGATYTFTPSLPGYTYSPVAPSVSLPGGSSAAVTVPNIVASSAIASYTVSGSVSYAGAKTGRTRVQVFSNGRAVAGITIASPGTGAYTIRGLQNGSYIVKASMGYLGTGASNATNPGGASATVTVSNANLVVANIAMTDPAAQTATTPTGLRAYPGNGSALLLWDPVQNANGTEKVTAYKIYWGTDALATNGTPIVVGAQDNGFYVQSGLADGSSVYYKIASCVSGDLLCTTGVGTASAVIVPVTIGATTGLNTVSGTVTYPGPTPTGHLMVAVYNPVGQIVEFTRLPMSASPMSYSVSGVADGTLGTYVFIDANDNGIPDDGELKAGGEGVDFTVSGNTTTTQNLTLTGIGASAAVRTRIFSDGVGPTGYSLNLDVRDGYKRVRDVMLVSGLNVAVPLDMGKDWQFSAEPWLGAIVPVVGSTYKYRVKFSDGTTEDVSASVTGVLTLSNMAQTLVAQTTAPGTTTVPLFTWAAPASPPVFYNYNVYVSTTSYGYIWEPNNSLPSGTLSVLYNSDGNASITNLVSGTTYYWQVHVNDVNGNQASKQATYTTP